MDTELRKHPTADERADDPYNQIANQSKSRALHDLASQPSGDQPDQQYDQQAFTRHVHLRVLSLRARSADGHCCKQWPHDGFQKNSPEGEAGAATRLYGAGVGTSTLPDRYSSACYVGGAPIPIRNPIRMIKNSADLFSDCEHF
jgi:hypothetical protein